MKNLKVFLASDHAGFELKEKTKSLLEKMGISFFDFGAYSFKDDDDYPDYVLPAVKKVVKTKNSFGIIFGGSGQGESIVANKVKGARAIVYYGGDEKLIYLARQHNNANILSLGARFLSEKTAFNAIEIFLKTKFSNEKRHIRRIRKISKNEK